MPLNRVLRHPLFYLTVCIRELLSLIPRRNPPLAPPIGVRVPRPPLLPGRSASVALEEPD
jgi:hypothetical protein